MLLLDVVTMHCCDVVHSAVGDDIEASDVEADGVEGTS